jgi:hypothetical protein
MKTNALPITMKIPRTERRNKNNTKRTETDDNNNHTEKKTKQGRNIFVCTF